MVAVLVKLKHTSTLDNVTTQQSTLAGIIV
jgi:hypothetical protein